MPEPTPAYYPMGWDRERMLNVGATGDAGHLAELSDEQMTAFREGLRADLGNQGYDQFFEEMFKREMIAKGKTSITNVREPPFMQVIRLHEERCGADSRWDPWGFVIFKSPEIRDKDQWKACRQQFDQILHEALEIYRGYPRFDECLSRMSFKWVEDVGDADGGFDAIAQAYASMNPSFGLSHSVCLYVTPSSLFSILNSPLPSSSNRRYRNDIPFVVAVSTQAAHQSADQSAEGEDDEDIEGAGWRGFFNVAVETLLESLFPIIADDSSSPYGIGGHVSGEDVWCDHTRWGIHKAGVGYWDRRTRQPAA
ncbi:hypothetical protein BJ170DRAFT_600415 [Xylariales sp. AK1849]|nr:hypothetical protein BJ170DRAFT_600415 [Xylariales sp. AK1849]